VSIGQTKIPGQSKLGNDSILLCIRPPGIAAQLGMSMVERLGIPFFQIGRASELILFCCWVVSEPYEAPCFAPWGFVQKAIEEERRWREISISSNDGGTQYSRGCSRPLRQVDNPHHSFISLIMNPGPRLSTVPCRSSVPLLHSFTRHKLRREGFDSLVSRSDERVENHQYNRGD
jgi:hypothetical protein